MSKERAKRPSFGTLLPGDVLVNVAFEKDVFMVLRVGKRLDLLHLISGRVLESWVPADARVPGPYDVLRGELYLERGDPDTV